MITTNESIDIFKEKIDELVNAKHLFAERKISEVLKVIAGSRMLYELFEYVTRGFDYKTFKSVCFISGGGVKLPKKDEDLLALCFLLLVGIDGGAESLDDLCDTYFPAGGSAQGKFAEFVVSVVIPFALTTEKVAEKIMNADEETADGKASEEAIGATAGAEAEENSSEKVGAKKKEAGYPFIAEAKENVAKRTGKKKPDIKEQADYIFDALEKSLRKRDFEGVTLAFTALRYFAIVQKKLKIDVEKISDGIAAVME